MVVSYHHKINREALLRTFLSLIFESSSCKEVFLNMKDALQCDLDHFTPKKKCDVGLADLTQTMADFASERDWEKFHSPRNLLLALVGEVGELSEIFQWKGEVPRGLPDWNADEKERLGEELSDVLLYLVRLADICEVNLGEAALRKLKKNAAKYPVERCKGSSKKYTAYEDAVGNVDINCEEL